MLFLALQLLPILAQDGTGLSGDLFKFVTGAGATGVLAVVGYGFATGKIVRKGELDDANARAKEWQAIAMNLLSNSTRAVGATERTAELIGKVVTQTGVAGIAAAGTGQGATP